MIDLSFREEAEEGARHDIDECRAVIRSCAARLYDFADALHTLGIPAGGQLADLADAISDAERGIGRAQSEEAMHRFRMAEEASTNMIRGVLAGIKLGAKDAAS